MKSLALINIGAIATGVFAAPVREGDAIFVRDGTIMSIGSAKQLDAELAETIIDCQGTTVLPGLIDSHCHVVLGDYTPRQKTVDFLDSYVHGALTSLVSAGVGAHAARRPSHPAAPQGPATAAATGLRRAPPDRWAA